MPNQQAPQLAPDNVDPGTDASLDGPYGELDEEQIKTVRDRYIDFHARLFGNAQAYDTVIIVGYGAFFGPLSSVGQNITTAARLLSVALIAVSLGLYLAWHI